MKVERGFTLVEILVVIAIVAIIGLVMIAIFTNTLRGSNKSEILSVIKQNGQAVLDNIDKNVRESDNVICPSPGSSSDTLVVVKNGSYTRYKFIPPNNTNPTIGNCGSVNGCIQQDNFIQPATSADIKQFLIDVCNTATFAPVAPVILTDTNAQTGVSVNCSDTNCLTNIFTRNKPAGFKDQVAIKFNLKPGVSAPAVVAGQIDPVSFQTSIELR